MVGSESTGENATSETSSRASFVWPPIPRGPVDALTVEVAAEA
jgi:hypothetical protein